MHIRSNAQQIAPHYTQNSHELVTHWCAIYYIVLALSIIMIEGLIN